MIGKDLCFVEGVEEGRRKKVEHSLAPTLPRLKRVIYEYLRV